MENLTNNNEELELEPKRADMEDPEVGRKTLDPKCVDCEHNLGRECAVYKCHRLLAPVNIFDCPSYENAAAKKQQTDNLFGVKE